MAPPDPDDDEARTRAADETAGNRFDDGYWATVENRDADDVYVMDVVLEGDSADVVAALRAFDPDADDPVAALRAAFDERAAAAAAGHADEDAGVGVDAAGRAAGHDVDGYDVDADHDSNQDLATGRGIGT
jgi:hypothetical protein